jgi:integrase
MKSWSFLYTIAGKRREKGLGGFPAVSLATARRLALKNREMVAAGRDPLEEADRKPIPTFGTLADEYIRSHSPAWRNEKHRAQWVMTLERYAKPLRAKRVNEIQVADVLGVLEPVWTTRPETASRLRGRIEAVLDAAKARGYRNGENPAAWRGNLRHLLPSRVKLARGHHRALPFGELPDFLTDLRRQPGMAAYALEFIILTAARSAEVLGARWGEFDLHSGVWTIPALRMKGGREHRVPLSGAALEVLRNMALLRRSDRPDAYVFPGACDGQPLSGMSTAMVLRRMERDKATTTHGFRSSFRDWVAECTAFPREIAEAALAHRVGNAVEQAYRRGDALDKRRELMSEWAAYLSPAIQLNTRIQPIGPTGEVSRGSAIPH